MSCPDCFTGTVLEGEPTGTIDTSLNNNAYLAKSPNGPTKRRAVVLLSDIFGLALNNPKVMADQLAARLQCDVWVPDMFDGTPPVRPDQLKTPSRPGERTFFTMLRILWTALPAIPAIYRNRPAVADVRINAFFDKLKAEKQYEKIGTVGFCFGGAAAVRISGREDSPVDTIVVAHPASMTIEQVKAIKKPASWECAEDDFGFAPEFRMQVEAVFAERQDKLPYEFVDYKGTTHGFAARPNLAYPEIKEAFEKSFEQTVAWFDKTIPV